MPITAPFANGILDSLILRHTRYVSLHTDDPVRRNDSEVSGQQYQRQAFVTEPAKGGVSANSEQILFNFMPAVTVTHVGLWTDQEGGGLIWSNPVKTFAEMGKGKPVNEDDSFEFAAGALNWGVG